MSLDSAMCRRSSDDFGGSDIRFTAGLTGQAWPARLPLGGHLVGPVLRPGGATLRRRPTRRRPPVPGREVSAPLRTPGAAARTGGEAATLLPADLETDARRRP